jgi:hypothetical protein
MSSTQKTKYQTARFAKANTKNLLDTEGSPCRGLGISDEQSVLTPREQSPEISIEGEQMLAVTRYG